MFIVFILIIILVYILIIIEAGGTKRVFPFQPSDPKGPIRTEDSYTKSLFLIRQKKLDRFEGIKGKIPKIFKIKFNILYILLFIIF